MPVYCLPPRYAASIASPEICHLVGAGLGDPPLFISRSNTLPLLNMFHTLFHVPLWLWIQQSISWKWSGLTWFLRLSRKAYLTYKSDRKTQEPYDFTRVGYKTESNKWASETNKQTLPVTDNRAAVTGGKTGWGQWRVMWSSELKMKCSELKFPKKQWREVSEGLGILSEP